MTPMLEQLQTARAGVADDPGSFVYRDFSRCTCGHIYRAVAGTAHRGKDDRLALLACHSDPGSDYDRALRAVIAATLAAHPDCIVMPGVSSSYQLSALTPMVAHRLEITNREAAIHMYDLAIAREERLDEQARLDVLAQLERAVLEAEPVPESEPELEAVTC